MDKIGLPMLVYCIYSSLSSIMSDQRVTEPSIRRKCHKSVMSVVMGSGPKRFQASRLACSVLLVIIENKIHFLIRESIMPRQYAIDIINNGLRLAWKDALNGKRPHTI